MQNTCVIMAPQAHYRYSAAVECAQSQWESVNNRSHHKMQEDGSVVLVDPTQQVTSNVEIQKIDPARLSPFEVQPADPAQPATQHGAEITVNKLGQSRLSPFEPSSPNGSAGQHSSVPAIGKKLNPSLLSFFDQPKVEPFNKSLQVASPLMSNANKFDHQDAIVVTDIMNEILGSAPGSNIKPSTQSIVNDDLEHHKSSSSIRSKDLGVSATKGPSIGGTKAMQGYLKDTVSNGAKYSTKVPVPGRSGFNHFTRNAPGFSSIRPIPSKRRDQHKGLPIGETNAMPGYLKGTASNGAKHSTKVPIPVRSELIHFTRNAPGFPSIRPISSKQRDHKGSPIGDTNATPGYLKDTVSNYAKYSNKVPVPGRSGFNHFTRNAPGFPSVTPIPSKRRDHKGPPIGDTNALPMYMADDTVSNASKRRTKVPITARSGFDSITKNNPGIPFIPSALPGIKNPKYEHVKPRFKPDTSAINSEEKVMPPMKSADVFDVPQVRSIPPLTIKSDFAVITTGARSGFDSITRNNPGIPLIPSALPGRKNNAYINVQSQYAQNAKLLVKKEPAQLKSEECIVPFPISEDEDEEANDVLDANEESPILFDSTKTEVEDFYIKIDTEEEPDQVPNVLVPSVPCST